MYGKEKMEQGRYFTAYLYTVINRECRKCGSSTGAVSGGWQAEAGAATVSRRNRRTGNERVSGSQPGAAGNPGTDRRAL